MVNNIRNMRSSGNVMLYHQRGVGPGGIHDGGNVGSCLV